MRYSARTLAVSDQLAKPDIVPSADTKPSQIKEEPPLVRLAQMTPTSARGNSGHSGDVAISICGTNYNCAHALEQHLQSVYSAMSGLDFEYIVVDNHSKDRSLEILQDWESKESGMRTISRRCTMGEGRQIAFRLSRGAFVMILDTDVAYNAILRRFVDAYLKQCRDVSVQAIYCGMFPRDQWLRAGGRRSLNTNEDVDLWMRISHLGTMKWYPVVMGENLKEPDALGKADHLSRRYSTVERVFRLVRREWDLLKTRDVARIDLGGLINANTIDLQLGPKPGPWPQRRTRTSTAEHVVGFVREFKQALLLP